jgi:HAD superfamily phosphatase (TIGR01668 family)
MTLRSVATGRSAFTTLFQILPRLATVVRQMRPTWHLAALADVTPQFLERHGIRGCVWDVDGTLTGDRRQALAPQAAGPFAMLLGRAGVSHVVLSNASEERYRQLGALFPEMPILRAYRRGAETRFRRLKGVHDSWTAADLETALADGFHVIRKPDARLVEYALTELKLTKADVVMLGDQYMTDVAGANLGGVRSIKLPTIEGPTFRRVVRFSQRLEWMIYFLVYGMPRLDATK